MLVRPSSVEKNATVYVQKHSNKNPQLRVLIHHSKSSELTAMSSSSYCLRIQWQALLTCFIIKSLASQSKAERLNSDRDHHFSSSSTIANTTYSERGGAAQRNSQHTCFLTQGSNHGSRVCFPEKKIISHLHTTYTVESKSFIKLIESIHYWQVSSQYYKKRLERNSVYFFSKGLFNPSGFGK